MKIASRPLPSLKHAKDLVTGATKTSFIIACYTCKKPLWRISDLVKYGSRWSSTKESFPGVPPYSEYWDKDQKTLLNPKCPYCSEAHGRAAVTNEGEPVFIPYCPDFS